MGLSFELNLQHKHMASHWNDDQTYGADELGVRLFFDVAPSPLSSPPNVPRNTHAIIRIRLMKTDLATDCIDDKDPLSMFTGYKQAWCIFNMAVQATREQCQCAPVMADSTPRNAEVCSPAKMRDCVHKKVVASGARDTANTTLVSALGITLMVNAE